MAKLTHVTCDRCGETQPADGATEWPHFSRRKGRVVVKVDFCGMGCFYGWIDARRQGSDLPLFAADALADEDGGSADLRDRLAAEFEQAGATVTRGARIPVRG